MSVDITSADEVAAARARAKGMRATALEAATQRHPSSRTAVDALDMERPTVMLDVDVLEPHPDNPRRGLGDITELTVDIALRGVDSPLTVVPHTDTDPGGGPAGVYRVVIGHRRLAAAVAAGLERVPCIVRGDLSRAGQRAMMLRENSHRADLSPVEEADAIQAMLDIDGLAVTDVAKAIARSETTVRRRMHLALAPEPARVKIHAGQATLEQWEKVLDAAGDDDETLEQLAGAMGTRNFDYTLQTAKQKADARRRLAKALADVEAAGIAVVETVPPGMRYVGQWPSRNRDDRLPDLLGAHPGMVALNRKNEWSSEVWLYAPPAEGAHDSSDDGDDDVEPSQGRVAREWGDPDAAQAQADAARQEERERARVAAQEHETARQVRAAFLNGLTAATGAKFDQARLWVVCQVVAEILAMQAINGDVLDVDADVALDLDDVLDEAVQEAKDAGDDPDTVNDYEVKSLAAPGRIERIGGPAALVRLVASALERIITPRDWLEGLRGHEEARAYYRLLDALGYVPSSVEEAALDSPVPQGAAS